MDCFGYSLNFLKAKKLQKAPKHLAFLSVTFMPPKSNTKDAGTLAMGSGPPQRFWVMLIVWVFFKLKFLVIAY